MQTARMLLEEKAKELRSKAMNIPGRISSTLREQDIEDIVHNAFLSAVRSIDNFRGESNLRSWFYTIVINATKNYLKRNREILIDEEMFIDLVDRSFIDNANPEQLLIAKRMQNSYWKAYRMLPEKDKMIYELRFTECLGFSEISEKLKLNINTVKSRYRRAVKFMKLAMKEPIKEPSIDNVVYLDMYRKQ